MDKNEGQMTTELIEIIDEKIGNRASGRSGGSAAFFGEQDVARNEGQNKSQGNSHFSAQIVPQKLGRTIHLNKRSGLPRYVTRDVTRAGTPCYVFRRDGKKITLVGLPGTDPFMASYFDALDNKSSGSPVRERKALLAKSQFAGLLMPAFKSARKRAYENAWAFTLDFDALLEVAARQQFKCCLTGLEFQAKWKPGRKNPYGVSIDRVDCSRGYEPDNVRLVLFAANVLLLDWGTDVADHIALAYVAKRGL
jgi:hypothetical protein